MSEVLKVLFEAAALCINTIRTFYLVILAMLGPLVFGLAVFDGFQHTVTVWLARYINVFLWLPVANIFGFVISKIQENMLKEDLKQIATNGDTFFSTTDTGYLIFMIIGIIGYFTVPSVANYIVHAGGGNTLMYKVTSMMSGGTRMVTSTASGMVSDARSAEYNRASSSMADYGLTSGYFKDKISGKS
jgi:conjugative transposon TraJ protein